MSFLMFFVWKSAADWVQLATLKLEYSLTQPTRMFSFLSVALARSRRADEHVLGGWKSSVEAFDFCLLSCLIDAMTGLDSGKLTSQLSLVDPLEPVAMPNTGKGFGKAASEIFPAEFAVVAAETKAMLCFCAPSIINCISPKKKKWQAKHVTEQHKARFPICSVARSGREGNWERSELHSELCWWVFLCSTFFSQKRKTQTTKMEKAFSFCVEFSLFFRWYH